MVKVFSKPSDSHHLASNTVILSEAAGVTEISSRCPLALAPYRLGAAHLNAEITVALWKRTKSAWQETADRSLFESFVLLFHCFALASCFSFFLVVRFRPLPHSLILWFCHHIKPAQWKVMFSAFKCDFFKLTNWKWEASFRGNLSIHESGSLWNSFSLKK